MVEDPLLRGHRTVHVVGVGGAGMSGLALLLSRRGHVVTGSDAADSDMLSSLRAAGIDARAGHDPGRVGGVDLVVASSAIPDADPELRAAEAAAIPVWRRPELLEAITGAVPTVGVTGTHGKTTGTTMLLHALHGVGLDPSWVIGGVPEAIGSGAGVGSDDLLVLEADEAFGTFESLHLRGLVVTTIEADHLDHFGDLDGVEGAFERVARAVDGPVVACADDPGAARLARRVGAVTYGGAPTSDWRMDDVSTSMTGATFRLVHGDDAIEVVVARPGVHTATNAAGVIALVGEMGHDPAAAAAGIGAFRGVGRRWEHRWTADGIDVIDDYAHHPTEVAATISAASDSGRRVVAVFQPHLYSRTAEHADAFGEALAAADVAVVLDVYGAREEPVPGVDGRLVSDAVRRRGGVVHDAPDRTTAATVVAGVIRAGDLVLTMGAGDITRLPDELRALVDQP